jgi:hypothetical protein
MSYYVITVIVKLFNSSLNSHHLFMTACYVNFQVVLYLTVCRVSKEIFSTPYSYHCRTRLLFFLERERNGCYTSSSPSGIPIETSLIFVLPVRIVYLCRWTSTSIRLVIVKTRHNRS